MKIVYSQQKSHEGTGCKRFDIGFCAVELPPGPRSICLHSTAGRQWFYLAMPYVIFLLKWYEIAYKTKSLTNKDGFYLSKLYVGFRNSPFENVNSLIWQMPLPNVGIYEDIPHGFDVCLGDNDLPFVVFSTLDKLVSKVIDYFWFSEFRGGRRFSDDNPTSNLETWQEWTLQGGDATTINWPFTPAKIVSFLGK